jgi:hypothetical protein
MRYMIYDDEGNALGAFRSRIAAESNLRRIAGLDPARAAELVLTSYRSDGSLAGARTIHDVPAPVRLDDTWLSVRVSGWQVPVTCPRVNRYERLVSSGPVGAAPLVRAEPVAAA